MKQKNLKDKKTIGNNTKEVEMAKGRGSRKRGSSKKKKKRRASKKRKKKSVWDKW